MPDARTLKRKALAYLQSAVAAFRPWTSSDGRSPQADYIRAAGTHRKRVFRAGNRTGKTVCVAFDAVAQLLGWHPAPHPGKPVRRCWASGLDWEWGIGEDLWPAFRYFLSRHDPTCGGVGDCGCELDPAIVGSVQWMRVKQPEIPRAVLLANGAQLVFKSADSKRRKYQGRGIDLLVINEEHPSDIVEEARRGLVTSGGQLSVALTPIERMRWVQDLEHEKGTLIVRASMTDAAHAGIADAEVVADYLAGLPDRQRRLRDLGDYADPEGVVYPSFSRETHVAQVRDGGLWLQGQRLCDYPIPGRFPRYAAWDFGYSHPTAVPRIAHDGDLGRIFVERCWHKEQIRTSRWAQLLAPDLMKLAAPIVCDHDADGRAELEAAGLHTTPANKRVVAGLELVERLLEPSRRDGLPKIVLVEDPSLDDPAMGRYDAYPMIREFELYRYPKDSEGKALRADHPIKRDDHAMDALRYICVWLVTRGQQMQQDSEREKALLIRSILGAGGGAW